MEGAGQLVQVFEPVLVMGDVFKVRMYGPWLRVNVYIAPNGPTDSSATWTRPLFIGAGSPPIKEDKFSSLCIARTYGLGIIDEGNCGEILYGVSFLARLRSIASRRQIIGAFAATASPFFSQMRPCLWKILATMCSGPEILVWYSPKRPKFDMLLPAAHQAILGRVHVRCFARLGNWDTMPHMRDTVLLKGIEAYGKDRALVPRGCQELPVASPIFPRHDSRRFQQSTEAFRLRKNQAHKSLWNAALMFQVAVSPSWISTDTWLASGFMLRAAQSPYANGVLPTCPEATTDPFGRTAMAVISSVCWRKNLCIFVFVASRCIRRKCSMRFHPRPRCKRSCLWQMCTARNCDTHGRTRAQVLSLAPLRFSPCIFSFQLCQKWLVETL